MTGGWPRRNALAQSASDSGSKGVGKGGETATTAVEIGRIGTLPPPMNDSDVNTAAFSPSSARKAAASVSARADRSRSGRVIIVHNGIRSAARSGSMARRKVASSAASVILSTRKARMSGSDSIRPIASRLPAMIPDCGPPSNLSPEKRTRSAPAASPAVAVGSSSIPGGHLGSESSGADVVDGPEAMGMGQLDQIGKRWTLGESDDPEVAGMDPQDGGRLGADRALVVREARLVRRPDLTQPGTGDFEDLREPETAADLHELAARHDDLAAGGHRPQGQDRRAGIVVHDRGGLGADQLPQDAGDRRRPPPAQAVVEVEFQVAITGGDFRDRGDRLGSERGPAEPGVEEHTGRVDHGTEEGPFTVEDLSSSMDDAPQIGRERFSLSEPLAELVEGLTDRTANGDPATQVRGIREKLMIQHGIDGRQLPPSLRLRQSLPPGRSSPANPDAGLIAMLRFARIQTPILPAKRFFLQVHGLSRLVKNDAR